MKVLFLMLHCPDLNLESSFLYSDLANEFKDNGHDVTIIAPALNNQKTGLYIENDMKVLRVNVLKSDNVSSVLKKGVALSLLPYQYKAAFKKYLSKKEFDLLLMPTPPITLVDFAVYIKKKFKSKFYLILRDIHPESCRSIETCTNPFIYKFLHVKAQKAYKHADFIGCMSDANIEFVKKIAPTIKQDKIVLLPNWQKLEPYTKPINNIREKYGLENKFIAVFGGTIGVGQDLDSVVRLAEHYKNNENIAFLVVGKGIRKHILVESVQRKRLKNVIILDYLPRNEYNDLLKSVDLGLISIDHRYKVPTCPSKIIGYMAMKIPVIAMINKGSDYGQTYIKKPACGLWSEDLDDKQMIENFEFFYKNKSACSEYGVSGYNYYIEHFTSKNAYIHIMNTINTTKV
jgi:glycosyltransferase involved in cell wall biosynthesis